jgi:hypothetical protein
MHRSEDRRVIRALAWFQIGYGALGLLSTLLLAFVMPFNPLPREAMIAGGVASAWVLIQGLVVRRYGPAVIAGARRRIGSLLRRGR